MLAQKLAAALIRRPQDFDVIVTSNMYGDILSDIAVELTGGLGLGGALNVGDEHAIAQATHGSAPDIAGRGIINPTATLLSAAMMLTHLGFEDAATRLDHAVSAVYAQGRHLTPDQGGGATTLEFCDAIALSLDTENQHA